MRTTPNVANLFQPLEDIIRHKFIPSLTGQPPPNDLIRDLLALPARLGGIAVCNPTKTADSEIEFTRQICEPLSYTLCNQTTVSLHDLYHDVSKIKSTVKTTRRSNTTEAANSLKPSLPASIPIKEFGFSLHKSAFSNALALRYNWQPSRLPTHCDCGHVFSIEHALSCPKSGFPSIHHNEIRDLTANLLTEICNDVRVEPDLQPVPPGALPANCNNAVGARLDIAANGFWRARAL